MPLSRRLSVFVSVGLALAGAGLLALAPTASASSEPAVEPITWESFAPGATDGERAASARGVLLNTNRYALQTWFPERFGGQSGRYLDLGGAAEANIRPAASEALALAASLATGAYEESRTGVSRDEAHAVAERLVASIAHRHRANGGNWGDAWQSALWAYYAGFAGWLLWDELAPDDREQVRKMIVHEANRFLEYEVPYFRDADDNVVYPGDSKAEENAWNANLLQLATAMMPTHERQEGWMAKNLELMISAFSRPADLGAQRLVNGRRLGEWLAGSNISDDGTLVNHGFIHPDYMATVIHNTNAALAYGLAREPTPKAAFHNADLVYDALVDLEFASPPYRAPGGTIYRDDSPDLYYPQGNDWGTHRRMHVALLDAQASLFGFDQLASTGGAAWERLHAGMVGEMQARFEDGRTYGAAPEDTYSGREQWVAAHAAQAWLTHWLAARDAISITNRPYVTGRVEIDAPRFVALGEPAVVKVTFQADAVGSATDVELALDAPPEWTLEPVTATRAKRVRPGGTFVARWQARPGPGAETGPATLTAGARWTALDRPWSDEDTTSVGVAPEPPEGQAYLSDLEWVEARIGYPRDGSGTPLRDQNTYGDKISIEDTVFDHGLWAHAASSILYYLGAGCERFTATVGIDDSMEPFGAEAGSVVFRVLADGSTAYDSGPVNGATTAPPVDVDLTGVRELELVATDGGNGITYDHAVWGDPLVECGGG